MKKNKEIKGMSLYGASDFWDEHDFGEFDDIKEVRDIKFSLKKKKYVGIDIKLYSLSLLQKSQKRILKNLFRGNLRESGTDF